MAINPYVSLAGTVGVLELEIEELALRARPLQDVVVDNHLANIRELLARLHATCNCRIVMTESIKEDSGGGG